MDSIQHPSRTFSSNILSLSGICIGVILLIGANLRETPIFWRNAGGYPIWLREVVLTTFYPLLMFHFVLLLSLSWGLIMRLSRTDMLWWTQTFVVFLNWVLMGVTVVVVLANNVANLLEGRELHSHPF